MFEFHQENEVRGTVKFEYNGKDAKVQFPYIMEHMDVVLTKKDENVKNELKIALTKAGLEVSTISPIGGFTVAGINKENFISMVHQIEALGYTAEIWNK